MGQDWPRSLSTATGLEVMPNLITMGSSTKETLSTAPATGSRRRQLCQTITRRRTSLCLATMQLQHRHATHISYCTHTHAYSARHMSPHGKQYTLTKLTWQPLLAPALMQLPPRFKHTSVYGVDCSMRQTPVSSTFTGTPRLSCTLEEAELA